MLLDLRAPAATEEAVRALGVPVLSAEVDVADEAGVREAADDEASGFVNGQELGVDGGWHADGTWHSLLLTKR